MIDLEKEFRTLRLLGSALIIIGAGLTLGGFGIALLMRDPALSERRAPTPPPTVSDNAESDPVKPIKPAPLDPRQMKQKLSSYTGQIGWPTGLLGVLFLGFGFGLRWIVHNTVDDDDSIQDPALFRAYAEQLVVAERQKAKSRKRFNI